MKILRDSAFPQPPFRESNMSLKSLVTAFFLTFAACTIIMPDYADAARLGGGRSFGSKPAMRSPATPPAAVQRQAQPNAAQRQNAVPGQTGRGFLGGMGGILGGLLAGTLIGSLLSGAGFSGGGLLDILLIGVLIFVGLKLFARRRASAPSSAPAAAAGAAGGMMQTPMPQPEPLRYADTAAANAPSAAQDAWSALGDGGTPQPQAPQVPAGFDADEFLRGAKLAYTRLQASWDKRDLNDIAQFTTPAVQEAIREQLSQEPQSSRTEIMLINAQLLEVTEDGSTEHAQVYFDVLLREDPAQQTPTNAREIWHFVRDRQTAGMWKLDGIQQISA